MTEKFEVIEVKDLHLKYAMILNFVKLSNLFNV